MEIDRLTQIRDIVKRKTVKPVELVCKLLSLLGFKKTEVKIYKLLLKEQWLKVKDIGKKLSLSDRTVREYLRRLLAKNYIQRKVVEKERLAYVYASLKPSEVWAKLKKELQETVNHTDLIIKRSRH